MVVVVVVVSECAAAGAGGVVANTGEEVTVVGTALLPHCLLPTHARLVLRAADVTKSSSKDVGNKARVTAR